MGQIFLAATILKMKRSIIWVFVCVLVVIVVLPVLTKIYRMCFPDKLSRITNCQTIIEVLRQKKLRCTVFSPPGKMVLTNEQIRTLGGFLIDLFENATVEFWDDIGKSKIAPHCEIRYYGETDSESTILSIKIYHNPDLMEISYSNEASTFEVDKEEYARLIQLIKGFGLPFHL
jgi:hypothetical protein